jgi:hypothetical protein
MAAFGVNLAPLLASAGVAGVAIGMAAQSIVKDMLNGIIILMEDQFDVGDTVRLAGLSGTVESMTLRKTTVRDGDGTLYVIPNSQITTVANLSVDYSVATINVSVDFSANPDKVQELLSSSSPSSSRPGPCSSTVPSASFNGECAWLWKKTTCCPAIPTASLIHSLKVHRQLRHHRSFPKASTNHRQRTTPRPSSPRKPTPSVVNSIGPSVSSCVAGPGLKA